MFRLRIRRPLVRSDQKAYNRVRERCFLYPSPGNLARKAHIGVGIPVLRSKANQMIPSWKRNVSVCNLEFNVCQLCWPEPATIRIKSTASSCRDCWPAESLGSALPPRASSFELLSASSKDPPSITPLKAFCVATSNMVTWNLRGLLASTSSFVSGLGSYYSIGLESKWLGTV